MLQYRQGITDFTTVLTAEQNLLTYQDSLAITLGDISSNLVGVYRAMGGGWQLTGGPGCRARRGQSGHGGNRTNWGNLLTPVALPPQPMELPQHHIRPPQW